MSFKQVRPVRSFEDIVRQIQDAIAVGDLQEGDRLENERELCEAFGVSRATLREALRWLEALGVIEIRAGSQGGIFITSSHERQAGAALETLLRFHEVEAEDLSQFRVSFEGETAYWAALHRSEEDIDALEQILADFELAIAAPISWGAIADLDMRFHGAIARCSKNRVREAIMHGIHYSLKNMSVSMTSLMSEEYAVTLHSDIKSIIEAIAEQDAERSRSLMQEHVQELRQLGQQPEEASDEGPKKVK